MHKKQHSAIDEIELKKLNISNFYKEILAKKKPVLITKIFEHIPSLSCWSVEFLTKKLGNKLVKVNTSNTGIFDLDPKTGSSFSEPIYIKFADYIDTINNNSKDDVKKLYMQQISLRNNFPELKDEIKLDKYISSNLIKVINLWVGPGGNTSPLHYDRLNNFFIQLYGTKKMWLYDTWQFYYLYPNSCLSKAPHVSKINAANVDSIKYPRALKAKVIKVTIPSGSILFIPAYWWHQVYSVNTAISVNIWCRATLRQKAIPGYFHDELGCLYNNFKDLFNRK